MDFLPEQKFDTFQQPDLGVKDIRNIIWIVTFVLKNTEPQTTADASFIFTALYPCELIAVVEKHDVISGVSANLRITLDKNGNARGSGNQALVGDFDLTSTARTAVIKMATTTRANRILDKGDSLGMSFSGNTPTNLADLNLTIYLRPLTVALKSNT